MAQPNISASLFAKIVATMKGEQEQDFANAQNEHSQKMLTNISSDLYNKFLIFDSFS